MQLKVRRVSPGQFLRLDSCGQTSSGKNSTAKRTQEVVENNGTRQVRSEWDPAARERPQNSSNRIPYSLLLQEKLYRLHPKFLLFTTVNFHDFFMTKIPYYFNDQTPTGPSVSEPHPCSVGVL
jgi:hypothetical protein